MRNYYFSPLPFVSFLDVDGAPRGAFCDAPIVEWFYDGARDAIVVTTTTKAYTLIHLGHLNATAEVPPAPTLVDLLEFSTSSTHLAKI